MMQRTANENAACLRRICKRSDQPKIERIVNNDARLILRLRTENLKNHTLFRGTYLYSPYHWKIWTIYRLQKKLMKSLQNVYISFVNYDVCKFAHLQRCFNLHKKSVNFNAFRVLTSRKMSVKSCYFSSKFRLKFTEILWHTWKSL